MCVGPYAVLESSVYKNVTMHILKYNTHTNVLTNACAHTHRRHSRTHATFML